MITEWYSGLNDYKKLTFIPGEESNTFITEILDVEPSPFTNIHDTFAEHLRNAHLPVEVLYSGGLDSECVLVSCLINKIPVIAVTMRILVGGCPINIVDLYYSEQFCRENGIKQVFYDLELDKFLDNGDHIQYMDPYQLDSLGGMSMHWLIEQCHSFPVIGGDYAWPLINIDRLAYSPTNYSNATIDLFMREKGIPGISNMISHSMEANIAFISEHLSVYQHDSDLRFIKNKIMENLGFGKLQHRIKSNGWELTKIVRDHLNIQKLNEDFATRCRPTQSIIKWNQTLANLIGGEPGENNDRGMIKNG